MNKTPVALALFLAVTTPIAPTFAGPIAGNGASAPISGPTALLPVLNAYLGAPGAPQRMRQKYGAYSPLPHFAGLDLRKKIGVAGPLLAALSKAGATSDTVLDDTAFEKAYAMAAESVASDADARLKSARAIDGDTDLKSLAGQLNESATLGFFFLDAEHHEQILFARETVKAALAKRLGGKIEHETRDWSVAAKPETPVRAPKQPEAKPYEKNDPRYIGISSELTLHSGVASEKEYWKHVDLAIDGLHAIADKVEGALKTGNLPEARAQLGAARFLVGSAKRAIAAGKRGLTLQEPRLSRYYKEAWVADHTMRNNSYSADGRARFEVFQQTGGDVAGIEGIEARLTGLEAAKPAPRISQLKAERDDLYSEIGRHYRLYSRMPAGASKESWDAYNKSEAARARNEARLAVVKAEIRTLKKQDPSHDLKQALALLTGALAAASAFAWSLLAQLDKVFVPLLWTADAKPVYLSLFETLANHPFRLAVFVIAPLVAVLLAVSAIRRIKRG